MTSSELPPLPPPSPPAFGPEGEGGARRFRELFNKAAIPLCFVNKAGGSLRFSAGFEATFAYDSNDLPTLADWWRLAYLTRHGCPIYQGYLFGRPMPLAGFNELVSGPAAE